MYAVPIRPMRTMPIQYAEKLPAVRPERMLSDGPPSLEEVTTSRTCPDSVEVKTLMSSGMMAPAAVPHVMMTESFHQSDVSPPRVGMSCFDTMNVRMTEMTDVRMTSCVSGCSKFILSALPYLPFASASLMKYATADATTITMRMTKIQTSSWTWIVGFVTARRMNEMSATPVTP